MTLADRLNEILDQWEQASPWESTVGVYSATELYDLMRPNLDAQLLALAALALEAQ